MASLRKDVEYTHFKQGVYIVNQFDWQEQWGDMPDVSVILSTWLSTNDAATEMEVTNAHVRRMCIDRAIPSAKIGGRWYVEPKAASKHLKGKWRY